MDQFKILDVKFPWKILFRSIEPEQNLPIESKLVPNALKNSKTNQFNCKFQSKETSAGEPFALFFKIRSAGSSIQFSVRPFSFLSIENLQQISDRSCRTAISIAFFFKYKFCVVNFGYSLERTNCQLPPVIHSILKSKGLISYQRLGETCSRRDSVRHVWILFAGMDSVWKDGADGADVADGEEEG